VLYRDYNKPFIRILIKQPVFNGKYDGLIGDVVRFSLNSWMVFTFSIPTNSTADDVQDGDVVGRTWMS